jgi:hypothetical protein
VRINEPPGMKNASNKKETYRWTLKALGGVSVPRPPQQYGPFGAKLRNSTLHSKKIQHKPSSGNSLWARKQSSDSKFELTL